jgi:hypothetical protein
MDVQQTADFRTAPIPALLGANDHDVPRWFILVGGRAVGSCCNLVAVGGIEAVMNLNEVLNAIDPGPPSPERAELKRWVSDASARTWNRRYAPESGPAGRRPALPPWANNGPS